MSSRFTLTPSRLRAARYNLAFSVAPHFEENRLLHGPQSAIESVQMVSIYVSLWIWFRARSKRFRTLTGAAGTSYAHDVIKFPFKLIDCEWVFLIYAEPHAYTFSTFNQINNNSFRESPHTCVRPGGRGTCTDCDTTSERFSIFRPFKCTHSQRRTPSQMRINQQLPIECFSVQLMAWVLWAHLRTRRASAIKCFAMISKEQK